MPNTADQRLVNEVEAVYRQFMYLPHEHYYTVAALWVPHTHLRDHSGNFMPQRTPRLVWLSKQAGCGKTMGMELTCLMSHNGELATTPSQFGLVCAINNNQGTVGLDEIDKFFGNRGTSKQDIQAVINSGYKAGAMVQRQRNDEVMYLNCHGPFTMAGKNANRFLTSDVFETTRGRSIPLVLDRKPVGHPVDKYRSTVHDAGLKMLSGRLKRWGQHNTREVCDRDVSAIMDRLGIDNRDEEIWTVLFQIAYHIGGNWPARVEAAARALVLGDWGDDEAPVLSPAEELAQWVESCFVDEEQFLPTRTLIQRLMTATPASLWWHREWRSPNGASQDLARKLAVLGVEATREYVDGVQVRGYSLDQLRDEETSKTGFDEQDRQDRVDVSQWDWSDVDA